MNSLKVASVQFNHTPGDISRNRETVRSFVHEAAEQEVDLIVFPEMCLSGYWHVRNLSRSEIEELAEVVPSGTSSEELSKLSREKNIMIGAGLIEIDPADGKLYNTYVVAMPDGRIESHRKIHTFISEHMSSGDSYTVFETPQGWKLGVLICYDCNIVENVRITALMGADILLAPHQTGGCDSRSPGAMGLVDPELWENREVEREKIEAEFKGPKGRGWLMRWLPSRAHDNGLFVIFSNGVGLDDDEVRTGNAMILGPYGEILAETCEAADKMVISDLDPELQRMATGRRWIRSRRPELYKPLTVPTGREVDTRTARFTRDL